MKKAAKKLLFLVCFGGCGYLLRKVGQTERSRQGVFPAL